MNEFITSQIDNNLSIIIYILALKDKRYDLMFRMLGGENEVNYKRWRDIKRFYEESKARGNLNGMNVVLNPNNSICKNYHVVSVALILDLPVEFIKKASHPHPTWITDSNWLNENFNKQDIQTIIKEKNAWKNKMKKE